MKALCKGGRFDPAKKTFAGTAALITNPIVNPMARGKVWEAIKFTFGNRLFIRYEAATHRYIIFHPCRANFEKYRPKNWQAPSSGNKFQPKPMDSTVVKPTNSSGPVCNTNFTDTHAKSGNTGIEPRGPSHMRPRLAPKGFEHTEESLENCVKWEGWSLDAKKLDDSFRDAQKYEEDQKKREERVAALAKTTVEIDPNRQHFRQTVVKTESKVENKVEVNNVDTIKSDFVAPHLRKRLAAAVGPADNKTE